MATDEKTIYVYADWSSHAPVLMGRLYVTNNRGKELFSFAYSKDWVRSASISFTFDPDLHLFEGRQYAPGKPLFGVFSDSCPDRWGKLLMKRKEAILAKAANRKPRALTESDYLLGVFDETRIGALRYSTEENGLFLSAEKDLCAPPWTTLRTLESASLAFESAENGEEEKWLRQLLAPGSSLGGARPKASVQAPDGSLWIAKFPSKHDEWNTGAWELVVHDLAAKFGLIVPEAKLETFSDTGGTFLVKRFDRNRSRRIHFSSAMALLGKTDGDGTEGVSYLDIAAFIRSNGASPKQDLKELWKRIVFTMAVSNTDDHLRNHGFLLTEYGWTLSPLYDVNPNIYGDLLSLNVSTDDNSISFALAIETAAYYDIDLQEAKSTVENVKKIIGENWRTFAKAHGLSRDAVSRMEPAFAMEYK
ncbi:MAG: HipA domain-containing protein [Oscillospiraceae bacterium]|nr:HipA domain-containing protein [Oscillospiraceae bacterium]